MAATLARELPALRALMFDGQPPALGRISRSGAGWKRVREALDRVQGHPGLLELDDAAVSAQAEPLATNPPPGKDRMIGIDATHAWAAVWTPQPPGQFEWLGLDPTNDQMVDERYVIVGRGRDYADVPPLRGIIYTNSKKSVIDVAVDVVPYEGDELYA